MAKEMWINIGSANGLLPEGTKPLPEPNSTNIDLSSNMLYEIHLRAI